MCALFFLSYIATSRRRIITSERNVALTGRETSKQSNGPLNLGEDFKIDEAEFKKKSYLFILPPSKEVFAGPELVTYEQLQASWLLVKHGKPVVPCPTNTVLLRRSMSKH